MGLRRGEEGGVRVASAGRKRGEELAAWRDFGTGRVVREEMSPLGRERERKEAVPTGARVGRGAGKLEIPWINMGGEREEAPPGGQERGERTLSRGQERGRGWEVWVRVGRGQYRKRKLPTGSREGRRGPRRDERGEKRSPRWQDKLWTAMEMKNQTGRISWIGEKIVLLSIFTVYLTLDTLC